MDSTCSMGGAVPEPRTLDSSVPVDLVKARLLRSPPFTGFFQGALLLRLGYPSAFVRNHTPSAAVTMANTAAPMNSPEPGFSLPLTRDAVSPPIQPTDSNNATIAAISHPICIGTSPSSAPR